MKRKVRHKRQTIIEIKILAVRANVTFGNYQSLHIEASADVLPGQTPDQVLEALKDFVATELVKARDGVEKEVIRQIKSVERFADRLQK